MAKAAASTTSKAKATESKPIKKSASSSDEMPKTATKSKAKTRDTGKKAKKDPNAPKRGLSAYMFFANDNRDKVREENPGISFGQVGKVLGDKWKALTDKQREPYDKKAATDKQRYEKEKAAYNAREDDEDED